MKKVFSWLLISALMVSQAWADSGPDQGRVETMKKKIAQCVDQHRRVAIETYDNRRLQGYISEAGTTDFVLICASQSTTLTYANVKKIRWPSPVWRQVKVVAGAGAILAAIFGMVVLLGGLKG